LAGFKSENIKVRHVLPIHNSWGRRTNWTFGRPFDKTLDKLGSSSRPFDAYDKFIEAEGHESFDRLRILSTPKDKKRVSSYDDTLFASNGSPARTRTADPVVNSNYL
jgi:hypothetical protein